MVRALGCLLVMSVAGVAQGPSKVPAAFALNLSTVADWGTEHPFSDHFRSARTWAAQEKGKRWGEGGKLDLDANGWPQSLQQGQFCSTMLLTKGGHRPGNYVCEWRGTGRIEVKGDAKVARRTDNRIDLVVGEQGRIELEVHDISKRDPVRDIRFVPAEKHDKTPTFDEVFLARCAKFRVLRFMDWMRTNDSAIEKWEDRPRPEEAVQTDRGVALEYMVELCNQIDAAPWFCIPHRATDEYVHAFAAAVASSLEPGLPVYVEYSNEVWNTAFGQARYAREQGEKLGLSTDPYQAQLRYYSHRAVEVFRIWEKEFGGTKRLVRVLAAQAASPRTSEQVLAFENAWESADALAIAPYFGPVVKSPEDTRSMVDGGLDEVFRRCKASIEANAGRLERHAKAAAEHGLPMIAYEGGQHLVAVGAARENQALTDLFVSANRDPRMGELYLADQESWRHAGGRLFAFFNSVGMPSKYGCWGLLESSFQNAALAPKYGAVLRLLNEHSKGW